ncbi:MAG: TIGR01777 family oxidoreductase [Jatrophihabitans sp.]
MKIVLTGASGLIGLPLRADLRTRGHDVITLVRRAPAGPDEDRWDPAAGRLDPRLLDGADAVVCLSGVGVGDHRWTENYKSQIVRSRVDSVGTVARTMAEHGGPAVLVSASAVGYYGDTGDTEIDEQAPAGSSFLADVCRQWEAAAGPARAAGSRVTFLRTGLVLAKDGGLLKRLTPIVKAGLGGKLGSGRQYMPWISLTDEVAAIEFLIEHDVAGPVNLTAPRPARNAEVTTALGAVLHRPTVFQVPGFAARIALGEFAGDVLTGQNAVPKRLLAAGFAFTHTDLETALRAELAK